MVTLEVSVAVSSSVTIPTAATDGLKLNWSVVDPLLLIF